MMTKPIKSFLGSVARRRKLRASLRPRAPRSRRVNVILELCKGVHCVDLGESFQTHIYLQNLASIQPRTSPAKFARSSGSAADSVTSRPWVGRPPRPRRPSAVSGTGRTRPGPTSRARPRTMVLRGGQMPGEREKFHLRL